MSETISVADATHVARLARLDLSAEELETYATQLSAVLDYAAEVEALDTSDVAPMAHPLPMVNVLREDDPRPSLDRAAVLAAAPESEQNAFRVPRILGEQP